MVTLTGTLNGCISTNQITINVGGVGIDESDFENSISIQPNPNNGIFEVSMNFTKAHNIKLDLYNSIGQVITSKELSNAVSTKIDFNLSEYSSGVYYLSVQSNHGNLTTKRLFISQ